VATFVGTSNIFKGDRAMRYVGKAGVFALRPEKIHLLSAADSIPPGFVFAAGTIREVFYLGMSTRYVVDLVEGGEIIVQEQNTRQDAQVAALARDRSVVLTWKRDDMRVLNG
jgi:putative spermidine/putrescine transport system ATP-binding protein